eukprot:364409-Chlamydomonas_euryale.AAC.12
MWHGGTRIGSHNTDTSTTSVFPAASKRELPWRFAVSKAGTAPHTGMRGRAKEQPLPDFCLKLRESTPGGLDMSDSAARLTTAPVHDRMGACDSARPYGGLQQRKTA